jgi:hypothetical protein
MIFNQRPYRDTTTIVVPYRKKPDRLLKLLDYLWDWRVLVADDSELGLSGASACIRVGNGSGFAKAVNRGLDHVKTPAAIVLNDDAWPIEDCLEQLCQQGGICGPVLVGPLGVESAGVQVETWGRVLQNTRISHETIPVQALSGACLHLPAGLRFDERFQHGSEDVALGLQNEAVLVGRARCYHLGGGSLSRLSPRARRFAVSGHLRLFGPSWRDPLIMGLALGQCLREQAGTSGMMAVWEGWKDARSQNV